MKHTTVAALLLAPLVTSCQTTLDPNFAVQMEAYRLTITSQREVDVAKARAEEARYQALAAIAERSDASTKSMAILALALSTSNNAVSARGTEVHLPRIPETQEDRALKWASVFAGPTTALISSYFGYQLGKTQSNNQAATTQASYAALVAFKPSPIDFSQIPPTTSNIITNTTNTDAWITNQDGLVVVGGAQPTSGQQDNSPIAVIPPVVVVPTSGVPTFGLPAIRP
jgi:hypothetical protein